jgi:hypothetical protein
MGTTTCGYLAAKAHVADLETACDHADAAGLRREVVRFEEMLNDAYDRREAAVPATLASARTKLQDALDLLDDLGAVFDPSAVNDMDRAAGVHAFASISAAIRALDDGDPRAINAVEAALTALQQADPYDTGGIAGGYLRSVLTALRGARLVDRRAH